MQAVFSKSHIMRYFIILSLLLIQACASNSPLRLYQGPTLSDAQEVTLILPIEFEIVRFNHQPVSQFQQTFRNQALVIRLVPGTHTLVLKYSDVWEIDSENHETLTSGNLTLQGDFIAGHTYQLHYPELNSYAQAKRFADSPTLKLVSKQQSIHASVSKKANPLIFGKDENTQQVDYPHLRQLKFWWSKANDYERQTFQQWIQTPQ